MKIKSAAAAALGVVALMLTVNGQSKIACDPDNGGITLPQGFCALVVANDVGTARHMAVANDGDGRFDTREQIGSGSTTGVALRNGYLYLAHPKTIERFKMTAGQLKPTGAAETIVTNLPDERQH